MQSSNVSCKEAFDNQIGNACSAALQDAVVAEGAVYALQQFQRYGNLTCQVLFFSKQAIFCTKPYGVNTVCSASTFTG